MTTVTTARRFVFAGVAIFLASASLVLIRDGRTAGPAAPGVAGKTCEIWDDPQGIPHARASSEDAGYACLGYLQGRDRAWQMDFFRRTAQGRKAEVFGKDSVKSDFFMRLLGLSERAQAVFEKMPRDVKEKLSAYAHGVNLGMAAAIRAGVYEFRELGYEPDLWQASDSVMLVLLQSFDQTKKSFQDQLTENEWKSAHGEGVEALFDRNGLPWDTAILKEGEFPVSKANPRKSASRSTLSAQPVTRADFPDLQPGPGEGSNNWVISPSRSKSGKALLANDPHLQLKHPPFWHWSHIDAEGWDVIGAALPGVPLVVSGANRHASWGLTNSFLPASRLSFVPEAELKNASSSRPVIWIRFGFLKLPFFFKTYQRTSQGWPVLPLLSPKGKAMVLRWTGFDLGPEDFAGFFTLMKSRTAEEVDRSLSRIGVPSWNFVFADDRGKIGYRAVGRIPKLEKVPAFGIPEESLLELEKNRGGFPSILLSGEMPHVLSPVRGFVVTANNRQWPRNARFSAGTAHADGFRAFRIEELLLAERRHDLTSFGKIQCDVQAVDARFLAPELTSLLLTRASARLTERDRKVLQALSDWDYQASFDCKVCGVFRRWTDRLFEKAGLDETSLFHELKHPSVFLANSAYEALDAALDDLRVRTGTDLLSWKELHQNEFEHLIGTGAFAAKAIPTPGDEHTVNPGTSHWDGARYLHTAGASQRLLVELTTPPTVYSVLAGSNQDGDHRDLSAPGSAWQDWSHCEVLKRKFPVDWEKVRTAQLTL